MFPSAAAYASSGGPVEARNSVARIITEYEDGYGIGTGFAVGDSDYIEFIATCYHVVEGDVLGITVSTEGGVETKATVYAGLPAADLAILQLSQPIPNMEPLPIYTGPMDANIGEPAYALGFPGASDILFDKPGNFADDVSITSGIVSSSKTASIFRDTGKEVMVYQIDVPLSAGNSGGPLLNGEGEVIGVNSFGIDPLTKIYMSAENINGAISSQELVYLLDSNGIGYKSSQNGASPIIPVVIICACAVVAVSALIYFLKKKGKGQMKNKTNQYVTLDEYLAGSQGAFTLYRAVELLSPVIYSLAGRHAAFLYDGMISPSRIMVDTAAQRAYLDTDIGLCGPPANVISPGYSPLEKYRRDMPQGGYTDVYGLAAVIYKILFRQDPPDALARMDNDQAVTNSIGSLGVLQEYKDKLARAFGISPQERYQNAGEFIAQFAIRPPAPEASAGPSGSPSAAPKNGGKKKLLWLIPVAAVAAVAVISTVLISGNNKTIEEARSFIGQGRYTQAVNTFNSALFMPYEANGDYIYAQAGAAKQDESYARALELLESIPGYPGADEMREDIILSQADSYLYDEDFDAALDAVEPIKDTEEGHEKWIDIVIGKADYLMSDYEYEEAKTVLDELPRDDEYAMSELDSLICWHAQYDLDEGDYESAIDILMYYPDGKYAHDLLIDAVQWYTADLAMAGEYDKAQEVLSQIEGEGSSAELSTLIRLLSAGEYAYNGDFEEARQILAQLLDDGEYGQEAKELLQEINSESNIDSALLGVWDDGNYSFEWDYDGYSSNLPGIGESSYVSIEKNGDLAFTDENGAVSKTYRLVRATLYEISLKDMDTGIEYVLEAVF